MGDDNPLIRDSHPRVYILFSLSVFFLVAVAVSTIVFVNRQNAEDRRVHAAIEKELSVIRAQGQPLTAEDLARLHPDPPSDRDAAILLKPALALLSIPKGTTNVPFFGETGLPNSVPFTPEVMVQIQNLLDTNQTTLDSIPWDRLERAWVGAGLAHGFTNLTHTPGVTQLNKLLCLRALLRAEEHDPHGAMQSLLQALLSTDTCRGGLTIHYFVRLSGEDRACQTLERIVNRTQFADEDLAAVSKALTMTNMTGTKDMVIGERCLNLFFEDMLKSAAIERTAGVNSPFKRLSRMFQARLAYNDDSLLHYLDWNRQCLEALDLPLSNSVIVLRDIEKEAHPTPHFSIINVFRRDRVSISDLFLHGFPLTEQLLSEGTTVAKVRATITALAIERWRLAHHGQLPASLTDLVPRYLPTAPIDPFNGQLLCYKKLTAGYVVYSVGPDFTDDGGTPQLPNSKEAAHYDVVFTVDK